MITVIAWPTKNHMRICQHKTILADNKPGANHSSYAVFNLKTVYLAPPK